MSRDDCTMPLLYVGAAPHPIDVLYDKHLTLDYGPRTVHTSDCDDVQVPSGWALITDAEMEVVALLPVTTWDFRGTTYDSAKMFLEFLESVATVPKENCE